MSLNAANLTKRGACDLLGHYATVNLLDIISICETFGSPSFSSAEMSLGGQYQVFRRDRPTKGGGVAILVKNELRCTEVSLSSEDAHTEVIAVDLIVDNFSVRLVSTYISPTGCAETLLHRTQLTCSCLEHLCQTEHPIIILGDFNLPHLAWSDYSARGEGTREAMFAQFCHLNGLDQMVDGPTRPASSNLLDLLLTNNPALIVDLRTSPAPFKSDHNAVSFSVMVPRTNSDDTPQRNFFDADYEPIAEFLLSFNWSQFFIGCDSVQHMYVRLSTLLLDLAVEFVPLRRLRSTSKPRRSLEDLVRRLTEQATTSPFCHSIRKKLTAASNRLRILRENSLTFRDSSQFFQYANSRLRIRQPIGPLETNDARGTLSCPSDMAAEFLTFFSSVYRCQSPSVSSSVISSDVSPPLEFTPDSVRAKLLKLPPKAATTPDVLPPIFFRHLATELSEPLALLFSRSLAESEVPEAFRLSVTTPIHKKGDRKFVGNYRPVSQLSIFCILMEGIVADYLTGFIRTSNLADMHQHGFMKGRSTETQLLEVVQDFAMAFSRKLPVHAIYFDFSKAFDTVNHARLLDKLAVLGIRTSVIRWIDAYLRNRKFVVKVGNTFSSPAQCPSGVPQGSVLGPVLWNIYILDISDFLPAGITYKLYADDVKVYTEIIDNSSRRNLQLAIDGVAAWAAANHLELSVPKCVSLKTRPCETVYLLSGAQIPTAPVVRDLGVLFPNDLLFKEQVNAVIKSSSSISNLILRSFIIKRPSYYTKLFRSLVEPRFLYCAPVWSPGSRTDASNLERVRSRFVRRVAERCGVPSASVAALIPSVSDLHLAADRRAMTRILASPLADRFFDISPNRLRSGRTIRPKALARSNVVHNSFSWRCCRSR